ncbi:O-antigen ligase family protein, partial [Candidatus Pelagibacter sp. HIMB1521]|uniref:O-antigen ligase family protein n=1 Tax=Candidatus Pelagibacter sp. HIMB1521 TaxID=3413344 RepID=UPI003F86BCEF
KRCHYSTSFFRSNIIFSENSHFGMISVAVTYYLLYLISIEKNFFLKLVFLLLVLSFFYNSSTTSILGYILSFFAVYICCYKKINNQFLLLTTGYLFLTILILFTSSNCLKRFQDIDEVSQSFKEIYNLNIISENKNKNKNKNESLDNQNDLNNRWNKLINEYLTAIEQLSRLNNDFDKNKIKKTNLEQKILNLENQMNRLDEKKFKIIKSNLSTNLTTQVYLRSFYILFEAIKEKPFGWGFNNYYLASNKYRFKVPFLNPSTVFLNSHDASNNFVKLITEFGVFGLFLLIIILLACLNNNIDHKVKIFFMPLIITQLIRGAGYFNGGFLIGICIFIILFVYKD